MSYFQPTRTFMTFHDVTMWYYVVDGNPAKLIDALFYDLFRMFGKSNLI